MSEARSMLVDLARRVDNASQGVIIRTNGLNLIEELKTLAEIMIQQDNRIEALERASAPRSLK